MNGNPTRTTILLLLTAPLAIIFASLMVGSFVGASFNILSTSNHWSIFSAGLAFLAANVTSFIAMIYCLAATRFQIKQLDSLELLMFWLNSFAFIGFAIVWFLILLPSAEAI